MFTLFTICFLELLFIYIDVIHNFIRMQCLLVIWANFLPIFGI